MVQNFDWNNLKDNLAAGSLETGKKKYTVDERFYKLARNENDTGGALVRLIPDADGVMFVKMTRIQANQGHERRFITDWSPQSIGLPDPVNERFLEEWNKGDKEEAKRFGRTFRYISNIKVIKDPANPNNEGKIFLYDMSKTMFDKVTQAAAPSPDEIALGTEPKAIYNPIEGNNFLLKVKRGSNSFITYEDSKFDEKITSAYTSLEAYNKDVKENGYILNDFLKPENFLSYDELKTKIAWYLGEDSEPKAETAEKTETVETVETPKAETVETPKAETVETPKAETVETPKAETPKVDDTEDDDLNDLLAEF